MVDKRDVKAVSRNLETSGGDFTDVKINTIVM